MKAVSLAYLDFLLIDMGSIFSLFSGLAIFLTLIVSNLGWIKGRVITKVVPSPL